MNLYLSSALVRLIADRARKKSIKRDFKSLANFLFSIHYFTVNMKFDSMNGVLSISVRNL